MTLHLKEIEQSDGDDVYEMFQELPKFELGSENIANGMTKIQFEDYKKKLVDNSKGLNLKTVINNTYYTETDTQSAE
jgi:hypothetical protein